jgi:hypothetical protein
MTELAPPGPVPARFGAGMAIATLILFLATQMSVGLVITLGGLILTGAQRGLSDKAATAAMLTAIGPTLVIASTAFAAAATLFATRAWAWHLVKDRSRAGLGVVPLSRRQLLTALLGGVALCGAYLAVAHFVFPPRPGTPLSPLMRIVANGVAGRVALVIAGLILAPAIEELLFRGLLLRGFAESWGMGVSATIVTLIFVALHVPEVTQYWPALIGIFGLAGATLAARLVTGSIFASMAVHAAYNAAIIMVAFIALS